MAKQKTAVEIKNKYAYVKQKAELGVAQTAAEASAKLEPSSRRPSKLNLQFLLMASFAWQRHAYTHTPARVFVCATRHSKAKCLTTCRVYPEKSSNLS